MSLLENTLSTEEVNAYDELYALTRKDKDFRRLVRGTLIPYLTSVGVSLKPYEVARLITSPSSLNYTKAVALFDYTQTVLYPYLVHNLPASTRYADVIRRIQHLKSVRKRNRSKLVAATKDAESVMPSDLFADPVPRPFVGEFFGYRRGSEPGEVIRFYLKTDYDPDDVKRVQFINYYIRRNVHWQVRGIGGCVNQTLYLAGHTRSSATGKSLGMRFFALRSGLYDGLIHGVLISMDEDGQPIASRLLMVLKSVHVWDQSEGYGSVDGDDFVERVLEAGKDGLSHIDKMQLELRDIFSGRREEFNRCISNATLTVVKASVPESGEALVDQEERVRDFCTFNELPMNSIMVSALKKYFDDMATG